MTKTEFARHISENYNAPYYEAKGWVDVIFEALGEVLADGESMMITDFGKFTHRVTPQKVGRHPVTKKPMTIPPRWNIKFTLCKKLDEQLEGKPVPHEYYE